jgi:hypothetical protein
MTTLAQMSAELQDRTRPQPGTTIRLGTPDRPLDLRIAAEDFVLGSTRIPKGSIFFRDTGMPSLLLDTPERYARLGSSSVGELLHYFRWVSLSTANRDVPNGHPEPWQVDTNDGKACINLWWPRDFSRWNRRYPPTEFIPALHSELARHGITPGKDEHYDSVLEDVDVPLRAAVAQITKLMLDVEQEVDKRLSVEVRSDALVSYFEFPPELRAPCEQYLAYFAQFLRDMGIESRTELRHEASGVLFSVTPTDGNSSLARVRDALDAYLAAPSAVDVSTNTAAFPDPAAQQYLATIFHLKSQLMLANATLQAKNATIELLSAQMQFQKVLPGNAAEQTTRRVSTSNDELTVLGGAVTIENVRVKGLRINLPEILRKLTRRS